MLYVLHAVDTKVFRHLKGQFPKNENSLIIY